jgi:hypothetical protein
MISYWYLWITQIFEFTADQIRWIPFTQFNLNLGQKIVSAVLRFHLELRQSSTDFKNIHIIYHISYQMEIEKTKLNKNNKVMNDFNLIPNSIHSWRSQMIDDNFTYHLNNHLLSNLDINSWYKKDISTHSKHIFYFQGLQFNFSIQQITYSFQINSKLKH